MYTLNREAEQLQAEISTKLSEAASLKSQHDHIEKSLAELKAWLDDAWKRMRAFESLYEEEPAAANAQVPVPPVQAPVAEPAPAAEAEPSPQHFVFDERHMPPVTKRRPLTPETSDVRNYKAKQLRNGLAITMEAAARLMGIGNGDNVRDALLVVKSMFPMDDWKTIMQHTPPGGGTGRNGTWRIYLHAVGMLPYCLGISVRAERKARIRYCVEQLTKRSLQQRTTDENYYLKLYEEMVNG